jgi:hypothetical protein
VRRLDLGLVSFFSVGRLNRLPELLNHLVSFAILENSLFDLAFRSDRVPWTERPPLICRAGGDSSESLARCLCLRVLCFRDFFFLFLVRRLYSSLLESELV